MRMGADHFAVVRRIGIEVVVVVIQTGRRQLLCLTRLQHAERDTGFQSQRLDGLHHIDDLVQILVFRTAPGSAHAET